MMDLETLLSLWRRQDPVMLSLHGVAIVSLAAMLDRSLYWLGTRANRSSIQLLKTAAGGCSRELLANISGAVGKRDYLTRIAMSAAQPAAGPGVARRLAREQLQEMNERVGLLDLAAAIAPLLGILGTVWGIALAFSAGRAGELPEPAALGAGVGLALKTTIWGLAISILASSFRFMFRQLTRRALARIENLLEVIEDAFAQR